MRPRTQFANGRDTRSIPLDDDELTEQELEVVVGGLARPWYGTWEAAAKASALPLSEAPGGAGAAHGTSLAAR
jgi:hypothetical protein